MTKNERVEILIKELAEISAILNSVKETDPVSKTLVNLAAEKAYYFGRNITKLLSDIEVTTESISEISHEVDQEVSEDFFAETEVENIFLQPEVTYTTRISTNPGDNTPWMPDSESYKEIQKDKKDSEDKKNKPEITECKAECKVENNVECKVESKVERKVEKQITVEKTKPVTETEKKEIIKEKVVEIIKEKEPEKPVNDYQKKAFESVFREHPGDAKVTSHALNDIRKLLTLNDRFLFQRELFRGDVGLMNFTYDEINKFDTFDEALEYLQQNFRWDNESQTVRDFMTLVERHFTGRIL